MSTNVFGKMILSPLARERTKYDLEEGVRMSEGRGLWKKVLTRGPGGVQRKKREETTSHDASMMQMCAGGKRLAHTLTLLCFVGVPLRTGSRSRGQTGVRKSKQGAARMRRVVARVGNRSDRGSV